MKKLLCSTILLGLSAGWSEATVLRYTGFNDLVQEADLILAGTVANIQSEWAWDKSTIYTFVTLTDLEVLDGQYSGTTFTLRLEGGMMIEDPVAKTGKALRIPGVPDFRMGERIVAFVKDNAQALCPLVGWQQGVLRLRRNLTGEERVHEFEGDLEVADILDGRFQLKPTEAPARPTLSIEEDDPRAKQLRLKHQQARMRKIKAIRSKVFTQSKLRERIRSKAAELKGQGKKVAKSATSADPNLHREGRSGIAVGPPRAN